MASPRRVYRGLVSIPTACVGPVGGIFGLGSSAAEAPVVLLPVPWEATTSYGGGASRGPEAILRASVQVDLFDVELGGPPAGGIAMLEADRELVAKAAEASSHAERVIEVFGRSERAEDWPASVHEDLAVVNELSAWRNQQVCNLVGSWLDRGKLVGVVGGDHSVAYGAIAACAERFSGLGVLQIDAHADLRVAYQGFVDSHASVMHRVHSLPDVAKVVSVGVRDLCREEHDTIVASKGRLVAFFDTDLAMQLDSGAAFATLAGQIADELPEQVYVSFDIDGLDPSLCPNTGTPVPGGLSFHQAMAVLRAVRASGRRIVGFDLCEVAPGQRDEWDGNVGARVLYKLIGYAFGSGRLAE